MVKRLGEVVSLKYFFATSNCSYVGMKLFFPGKLYLAANISHIKGNTSLIWFLLENGHVMIVCDCLDVLHAALTYFNFISVEYPVKSVIFWK